MSPALRMHLVAVTRVLFSAGLLVYVLRSADWSELAERLPHASWVHLVLLFVMAAVSVTISVWKWQLLLGARGHRVGFGRLFALYVTGQFYNQVLPSSVGGDVIRGMGLQKDVSSGIDAFSSIFVERLTGLVSIAVLGFVTVVLTPAFRSNPVLLLLTVGGVLGASAIVVAVSVPGMLGTLRKLLGRLSALGRVLDKLECFRDALVEYWQFPGVLLRAMMLSFLFNGGMMAAFWLATRALGYDLGFWQVALVIPAAQLGAMLPISFNGIGIVEWIFGAAFGALGLSPTAGLAAALLVRMRNVIWSSVGHAVAGHGRSVVAATVPAYRITPPV